VEVERVITDSPGYSAFLARCRSLVCLTFDTQIHDVISADSTVVNDDIPSPQSDRVPLLDFKPFFAICSTFRASSFGLANGLLCRSWDVCHNHVGHGDIENVEDEEIV